MVAAVRHMVGGTVRRKVQTFKTTTKDLMALSEWLSAEGCTHIAMEATGIYWKPVWHVLGDAEFELVLANAAHVKNVPGRKTDVNDATWLADLMAHGLIRGSFVPDAHTRNCALCCEPASNSCASEAATSSGSKRRWKMPTSSSTRLSPTSWA
jgi:transposase